MPCCRRYGSTHALSSSSPPTCAGVLCPTSATRLPSAAMHRRDRWQQSRTGTPVIVYQPWRATLRSGTEQQPAINGRCSLTPKGSRLSVLAPAQTDNLNIYPQKTILYLKKNIAFPVSKVYTFNTRKYILSPLRSIYFCFGKYILFLQRILPIYLGKQHELRAKVRHSVPGFLTS